MSFFTKRVRTGTVGAGVTKPVYKTVANWPTIIGTAIGALVLLNVLGNGAG